MKKFSKISSLIALSAAFAFVLAGCANGNNSGGGGGNDDTEPEDFTVISSSTGSVLNTTWLWSYSEEQSDYVAPSSGSTSGSSGDSSSGDSGSGDSGSGDSSSGDSGSGTGSTTTPEPQQVENYYLHIDSSGNAWYGKVKYTEKWDTSKDDYVIDTSVTMTYSPLFKGTVATSSSYFVTDLPFANSSDSSKWIEKGYEKDKHLNTDLGLNKASAKVMYRKTSTNLTLQTQKSDPDHSGCTLTTQYKWDKFTYDSQMEGPSEEAKTVMVTLDENLTTVSVSLSSCSDYDGNTYYFTVSDTDVIVSTLKAALSDSASYTTFAILGVDSGTVYMNGTLSPYDTTTKSTKTFGDVDDSEFKIVKPADVEVTIKITTSDSGGSTHVMYDNSTNTTVTSTSVNTLLDILKDHITRSIPDGSSMESVNSKMYNLKIYNTDDASIVYYNDDLDALDNGGTSGVENKLSTFLTDGLKITIEDSYTGTSESSGDSGSGDGSEGGYIILW